MKIDRRGFLSAILAAGVAPAVVRAESIMRIKPIVVPGDNEFNEVLDVLDRHNELLRDRAWEWEVSQDGNYVGQFVATRVVRTGLPQAYWRDMKR